MRHERAAVIARRIAELQQRRRAIVNDDCALESVSKRRKLLSAGDLFLERARSAGNRDTMSRDDATQTCAGRLAGAISLNWLRNTVEASVTGGAFFSASDAGQQTRSQAQREEYRDIRADVKLQSDLYDTETYHKATWIEAK